MGYPVTHITISSFPGCPCCPHTFLVAVPALSNVLFTPVLLPWMCHQKQPDPSLAKINFFASLTAERL